MGARLARKRAAALDLADHERTAAIRAMFLRFGYQDSDALVRARVLYFTQIGYYALDIREPIEARLRLTPHYLLAITGVPPQELRHGGVPRLCRDARGQSRLRTKEERAMTARYSAFALLREGLTGHKGWPQAWRKAKPKPAYDFVVVGGGGHGLATAYYLAKTHKRSNVCVIEKGWLGGGNTGRNTHDPALELFLSRVRRALRSRAAPL